MLINKYKNFNLLEINETEKQKILYQSKRDCIFLSKHNLMDYSLLLTIEFLPDSRNKVCHFGIIDYLQQFTFDKKVESFIKRLNSNKKEEISCVAPHIYSKRFYNFIENEVFHEHKKQLKLKKFKFIKNMMK